MLVFAVPMVIVAVVMVIDGGLGTVLSQGFWTWAAALLVVALIVGAVVRYGPINQGDAPATQRVGASATPNGRTDLQCSRRRTRHNARRGGGSRCGVRVGTRWSGWSWPFRSRSLSP
jgi:hypothetical protein